MIQRRTFLAAAAGAVATATAARAEPKRVFRFVPAADPTVLDPIWTTAYPTRNHGYLVFDTLYGETSTQHGAEAKPQMAAGHTLEDGDRVWRIALRDGLRFHDGQPVLARDCVTSILRWGARDALGQALLERTDALSAPDDRTVLFRLAKPFPSLAHALGKSASLMCAIMPEHLARTDPFQQVPAVIGSGPFKMIESESVPGARLVYERFSDYKPREHEPPDGTTGSKIAYFDRVEWRIIPDPAAAVTALRVGEVDAVELPAVDLLPLLRRDPRVKLELVYDAGTYALLRPNHLFPPFDNPAVRRVLLEAIDQADVMTAVAGDDPSAWRVAGSFFPPGSAMAGLDLPSPRRPSDVRAALQAAGYAGEKVVFLSPANYPPVAAMSEVIADTLRRSGMNLSVQNLDASAIIKRRASKNPPEQGGWSLFCTAVSAPDMANPGISLPLRANGERAWPGWPISPALERLREDWLDAPDLAAQRRVAAQVEAQALQDVPYVPLGLYYGHSAYRADLHGILRGIPMFWNVARGNSDKDREG